MSLGTEMRPRNGGSKETHFDATCDGALDCVTEMIMEQNTVDTLKDIAYFTTVTLFEGSNKSTR